jgi:uncharacterized coiled-coil protein SlyX
MIKKLTDDEKAQNYDQLWNTIARDKETIKDQSALISQLSDELVAMTKAIDKAGDMMDLMTKTATENREAYQAETLSTIEMTNRIMNLESECARLHGHWHAAEERANVAESRLKDRDERLRKLSNAASTLWEEHKAFGEDVHDTEGVDYLGSDSEGHAMMQALVDETI